MPFPLLNNSEVFLLTLKIGNTLCDKDATSVDHEEIYTEPTELALGSMLV